MKFLRWFLVFSAIALILAYIIPDGIFTRYGITNAYAIIDIKTSIAVIVAFPLSLLITQDRKHRENMPPLEEVSTSLAKDIMTKDRRYSKEIRNLIATELQKGTIIFKWNPAIQDLCMIPASSEPDDTTNSILERFYLEQANILARYGI